MAIRDELVGACIRILKKHQKTKPTSQATVGLLRDISLTLDQLHRSNRVQAEFLGVIEAFRIEAKNRLLNIRRDPHESANERIERNSNHQELTITLIKLESQRRQIIATHEAESRILEIKLSELVHEYELLELNDGDD